MIFSFEALRALHGDSLLVHFGEPGAPRTILVDGGPGRVYDDALKPRLQEIRRQLVDRAAIAADAPLPLALAMVSHIDDDHIGGLLKLTEDGDGELPIPAPSWVAPTTLWHNSFEDLTGAAPPPPPDDAAVATASAAVIASVPQGRRLRAQAELLGWPINRGFPGGLVQAPDRGGVVVDLGHAGTDLVVVAPRETEIDGLRREWEKQLRRLRRGEITPAQVAANLDNSPANLSSIVALVRQGQRSMLLTGDARSDFVLAGLDAAGLTDGGALHVDVLKLPHHGSIRNIDAEFLRRITADHYVISGDGRDGNPETETLDLIVASRPADADYTIHLTYAGLEGDLQERLEAFTARHDQQDLPFVIATRPEDALSLRIDLGDDPPEL